MLKIKITLKGRVVKASLYNSRIGNNVYNMLPMTTKFNTWGDEIFFSFNLDKNLEQPVLLVSHGDIAYSKIWKAFCIFYGKTPISNEHAIIPNGAVEVIGRLDDDPSIFKRLLTVGFFKGKWRKISYRIPIPMQFAETITLERVKGEEFMNICMIGCWYKDDLYSHSCYNLIQALKKVCNLDVRLVTSNCGCFSSAQRFSCTKEELINTNCSVIKIPYAPPNPNKKYGLVKYYAVKVFKLNTFLEMLRGFAFFKKTKDYDLIHFDQVLKSFGFLSFLTFMYLSSRIGKKIVVTVHEIDPLQESRRNLNRFYNKAGKIIAHSQDLKNELILLGVEEEKIVIIPFGVTLEAIKNLPRDQFIFFGGHRLFKGKGFNTLLDAMKIIKLQGVTNKLVIYVGEGCVGLEEGKKVAHDMGLDDTIVWSDFLYGDRLSDAYQRSIACVLPYSGGSGRYPVTNAMANATPVIATKKAGLPEYLDELGTYIPENSATELADAMLNLINNPDVVTKVGGLLRKRAEEHFSWEVIAKRTSKAYSELTETL